MKPCFEIKLVFLDSQEVNIKGCQGLNIFKFSHNDFSGSEVPPKTEFSILSHFQGIQTDSLLNLTTLILLFLNHLQVYFQNIYIVLYGFKFVVSSYWGSKSEKEFNFCIFSLFPFLGAQKLSKLDFWVTEFNYDIKYPGHTAISQKMESLVFTVIQ